MAKKIPLPAWQHRRPKALYRRFCQKLEGRKDPAFSTFKGQAHGTDKVLGGYGP
jgi:hypothetical protein